MRRRSRRGNGEGSLFFRRRDARWVASVTVGFDGRGRQIRKYFYGRTRATAAQKLFEAQKKVEAGLPVSPAKQTVGQFLARWRDDVARPNVAPKTYRTYSDLIKKHL